MIESMLMNGENSYVDTGPGPRKLIGYVPEDLGPGTEKGFFGEVPVSQLINGTNLASRIGLTAGTAHNNTDPWLKFIIDGKIYFVAKKTYRHSVSWNNIRAVNAVYGDRVIQIGDYQYRIGLLKGADNDPATYPSDGYNQPGTLNSEWHRLIYNVVKDNPTYPKEHQIGENWARYEQRDVAGGLGLAGGNGRFSWCQETMAHDTTRRAYRGYLSVSYSSFYSSSFANTFSGWRPRLELVTD